MTTILQIIPSLGAGGAEQACVDVAEGLIAAGHRAIVVSSGGALVEKIIAAGAEHILHSVASKNPLTMMRNALWLARFIREQKVDIVHARSRAPAWSAYWASCKTGCGFVTTFHAAYKFSNPLKKYYNSVMAKGDYVIAISDFIAAHIKDNYQRDTNKIRTIPRGIDLNKFASESVADERCAFLRKAWGIDKNETIILCPARLSPIKGQSVLIDAMGLLPNQFGHLTTIILGDDQGRIEYRRTLEKRIVTKGISDRVKMVPHCNDMPAAYKLSTLAIAPSLVPEGLGRVPIEAMAMGVTPIASDIGGLAEVIHHGVNGWLVPPGNSGKLAEIIAQALRQTPEQRRTMTTCGLQDVHIHYNKHKMIADTLTLYEDLMRSKIGTE